MEPPRRPYPYTYLSHHQLVGGGVGSRSENEETFCSSFWYKYSSRSAFLSLPARVWQRRCRIRLACCVVFLMYVLPLGSDPTKQNILSACLKQNVTYFYPSIVIIILHLVSPQLYLSLSLHRSFSSSMPAILSASDNKRLNPPSSSPSPLSPAHPPHPAGSSLFHAKAPFKKAVFLKKISAMFDFLAQLSVEKTILFFFGITLFTSVFFRGLGYVLHKVNDIILNRRANNDRNDGKEALGEVSGDR